MNIFFLYDIRDNFCSCNEHHSPNKRIGKFWGKLDALTSVPLHYMILNHLINSSKKNHLINLRTRGAEAFGITGKSCKGIFSRSKSTAGECVWLSKHSAFFYKKKFEFNMLYSINSIKLKESFYEKKTNF